MSLAKVGFVFAVLLVTAGCTSTTKKPSKTQTGYINNLDAPPRHPDGVDDGVREAERERERDRQNQMDDARDRDRERQNEQNNQIQNIDRSNGLGECPSCGR